MTLRFARCALTLAIVFAVAALLDGSIARAAVSMSTGIRYVYADGSLQDCSAKAKTALDAYLENAAEVPPGSGDWLATGPVGAIATSASGVVRCSPVGKGYVVTFTCVVQTPQNPYSADDLCIDVAHNFSGKAVKPLPTATPLPTGCTTASLIGTWTSDDKPGLSFTMDAGGDLTDSEGVSGNWGLYNNTVTLTYYGTHTLTLSADGKHLRGPGYSLTRKC